MHIISFFVLMLKIVFCYKSQEVQRGSDVSLRCDVPLLSNSSTLHWEKDGEQTPNSTLMYNTSAYIILHTVDESSEGKYYCRLMQDGSVRTVKIHTLNVTSYSHGNSKNQTISSQSSTNTNVSLICKSAMESPDGVLRIQSVDLTCEVSEVTDSVTLVWLRMEGNRGVLVKQQNMTEKNTLLRLTVNLSKYESDPLHWQCAVYTENTLRALVPITINCTSSNTTAQTERSTVTNQVIRKVFCCVLTLFTGILLGALLNYCCRKRKSVHSGTQESEPVYMNINHMRHDRGKGSMNKREEIPVTSDSLTYTTIVFNQFRFQT
ncbi:uncharacterized protein LOC132152970 isoform X4 [Carassius carassius]|uniref:uncharacterized protein LOC132152970 isoform X4 n=1 Tax=Carassius carassius TaxID=217509 RepID=UPI002868F440|nr:uncharacterized protein LOC132152970 isoform X4 [Carassius carassius]